MGGRSIGPYKQQVLGVQALCLSMLNVLLFAKIQLALHPLTSCPAVADVHMLCTTCTWYLCFRTAVSSYNPQSKSNRIPLSDRRGLQV